MSQATHQLVASRDRVRCPRGQLRPDRTVVRLHPQPPDRRRLVPRHRLEHPEPRVVRQLVANPRRPARTGWWTGPSRANSPSTTTTRSSARATASGTRWRTRSRSRCPRRSSRSPSRRSRRTGSPGSTSGVARRLFIATVSLLAIPLQVALIPLLQLYVGGAKFTLPLLDKTITLIPDFDLAGNTDCGVVDPHRVRHAVRDLPAAQLHQLAAEGPLRSGPHRRRQPLHDLLAAGAAAVGPGARGVRHLPVPVDLERLPRRQHDGRVQPRAAPDDDPDRQPGRRLRPERDTSCRRPRSCRRSSRSVVFFALQRYFVRGMLAGSVKG